MILTLTQILYDNTLREISVNFANVVAWWPDKEKGTLIDFNDSDDACTKVAEEFGEINKRLMAML